MPARPTTDEPAVLSDAAEQAQPPAHEPRAEHDAWLEEAEELPPRPRRRVLTPLPLALLAALALACGFIAGVLVEKGQGGSTSGTGAGGAFASRLAALRGAAGGSRSSSGSINSGSSTSSGFGGTSGASSAASGTRGVPAATGARGGSATIGQVAYATKGTLYVTTSEGNTVKVKAAAGASVTKTVKASIESIHPGETVVVAGASGTNGAIAASSIRVGGLTASGTSSRGATSGAGEPQLFGKG